MPTAGLARATKHPIWPGDAACLFVPIMGIRGRPCMSAEMLRQPKKDAAGGVEPLGALQQVGVNITRREGGEPTPHHTSLHAATQHRSYPQFLPAVHAWSFPRNHWPGTGPLASTGRSSANRRSQHLNVIARTWHFWASMFHTLRPDHLPSWYLPNSTKAPTLER